MNISHPSIQANITIYVYIHTHAREIYVCLEVVILFCCSSIYRIYEHQQQKHVAPKFLYLEKIRNQHWTFLTKSIFYKPLNVITVIISISSRHCHSISHQAVSLPIGLPASCPLLNDQFNKIRRNLMLQKFGVK